MWPLLIPSSGQLQSFDHFLIPILLDYIIIKVFLLKGKPHCIVPLTVSLQCLRVKLRIKFPFRPLRPSMSCFLLTSSLSSPSFCFHTPTLSKTGPIILSIHTLHFILHNILQCLKLYPLFIHCSLCVSPPRM